MGARPPAAARRLRREPPERASARTARYVAQKERDEWDEVAQGTRPWVDRNTFYVHYDAALFTALFGSLDGSHDPDAR